MKNEIRYESLRNVKLKDGSLNYYIRRKEPFVSRLSAKQMPALNWTLEGLKKLFGDRNVNPLIGLPQSGYLGQEQKLFIRSMKFNEFIERIQVDSENPSYLGYLRVKDLDELLAQQASFSLIKKTDGLPTDTRLWVGSKGTNSGLHTDLKDNLFVQVTGIKHLYLVSPSDTKYIYPFNDNIVNSQICLPNICLKTFPKARNASFIKYIVCPGDIVYIPKGWWHCLISQEPSISVNHWFGRPIDSSTYLKQILHQGPFYVFRTFIDLVRYGILKIVPKEDFFFTPPPNGARLFEYLKTGNFSLNNDPTKHD